MVFYHTSYKQLINNSSLHELLFIDSPLLTVHFKGDIETTENVERIFKRKLFRLCKLASADNEHRFYFPGLQCL